MRKDIKFKERHEQSGEGCKLYFVSRVELSSITPTTLTIREFL